MVKMVNFMLCILTQFFKKERNLSCLRDRVMEFKTIFEDILSLKTHDT